MARFIRVGDHVHVMDDDGPKVSFYEGHHFTGDSKHVRWHRLFMHGGTATDHIMVMNFVARHCDPGDDPLEITCELYRGELSLLVRHWLEEEMARRIVG